MRDVAVGHAADVLLCSEAANTQDGLPAGGLTLAGYRSPKVPETWDGTGPVPPGWSDWRAGVDPINGESECPWDAAAKMNELIQSLPPGEPRGALAAAYARLRKETRDD